MIKFFIDVPFFDVPLDYGPFQQHEWTLSTEEKRKVDVAESWMDLSMLGIENGKMLQKRVDFPPDFSETKEMIKLIFTIFWLWLINEMNER